MDDHLLGDCKSAAAWNPRAVCAPAVRSAMGALSQSGLMLDERALKSVAPALDQLYSVFNEVRSAELPHTTNYDARPSATLGSSTATLS